MNNLLNLKYIYLLFYLFIFFIFFSSTNASNPNPIPTPTINVQSNKQVEIIANGNTEIIPDQGYDALSRVSVTTNVQTENALQDNELQLTLTDTDIRLAQDDADYQGLITIPDPNHTYDHIITGADNLDQPWFNKLAINVAGVETADPESFHEDLHVFPVNDKVDILYDNPTSTYYIDTDVLPRENYYGTMRQGYAKQIRQAINIPVMAQNQEATVNGNYMIRDTNNNPEDLEIQRTLGMNVHDGNLQKINFENSKYELVKVGEGDDWGENGETPIFNLGSITVNVPNGTETKTITQNGIYTPTGSNIGFSEVTVNVQGGSANIQGDKEVTITENGTTTVTPDNGFDALGNVSINTNVQPLLESKDITFKKVSGSETVKVYDPNNHELGTATINSSTGDVSYKVEEDQGFQGLSYVNVGIDKSTFIGTQNRSITSNGNYTITPNDASLWGIKQLDLSVQVSNNLSLESNREYNISSNGNVTIRPSNGYDAMTAVTVHTNVPTSIVNLNTNEVNSITMKGNSWNRNLSNDWTFITQSTDVTFTYGHLLLIIYRNDDRYKLAIVSNVADSSHGGNTDNNYPITLESGENAYYTVVEYSITASDSGYFRLQQTGQTANGLYLEIDMTEYCNNAIYNMNVWDDNYQDINPGVRFYEYTLTLPRRTWNFTIYNTN